MNEFQHRVPKQERILAVVADHFHRRVDLARAPKRKQEHPFMNQLLADVVHWLVIYCLAKILGWLGLRKKAGAAFGIAKLGRPPSFYLATTELWSATSFQAPFW